jgi:hypothetical protein
MDYGPLEPVPINQHQPRTIDELCNLLHGIESDTGGDGVDKLILLISFDLTQHVDTHKGKGDSHQGGRSYHSPFTADSWDLHELHVSSGSSSKRGQDSPLLPLL